MTAAFHACPPFVRRLIDVMKMEGALERLERGSERLPWSPGRVYVVRGKRGGGGGGGETTTEHHQDYALWGAEEAFYHPSA